MTRDEMAFAIFLKRLPSERYTDKNRDYIAGLAVEALELANVFVLAADPRGAAEDEE